ncbi:CIS tube protein [Natronobiforma cellulositropha]|uniref:CIS tube protein n=1 Tax=Natronobiforma cellulositropha TaxID=1679076 RepID=UPI0021D607C7|nr:LysM peptidoglycan-binding domain-containing protein [Natronobiforma cellulositropha]
MNKSLEKAHIIVLNGKNEGTKIECRFNPTEYRIQRSVTYSENASKLDSPEPQFNKSNPDILTMELFFDTTDDESDVRKYTDGIDSLLEIDGELHAPPACRFVWGGGIDFPAVVTNADKRFTRFLPNGIPVRARANVTFREYKTASYQKSSIKHESTDKMKVWTVTEGDTLWLIGQEEYGDPSHWRTIAEANDIENPRSLEPGTKLALPPL